jgi:transmembrane sensor
MQIHWDAARTERALARARQRLVLARRVRAVAGTLGVTVTLVLVGWLAWPSRPSASRPAVAASSSPVSPRRVRFPDGTVIDLVGEASDVRVSSVSDERTEVELVRGRARFQVVPRAEGHFSVQAGSVVVEVVGTEFFVELRGDRTQVEVRSGRVRVTWAGGDLLLQPGAQGLFPLEGTAAVPAPPSDSTRPVDSTRPADAAERFRAQARNRDYAGAYQLLVTTPAVVGTGAADLMLAADVARLSGHAADAIPYLERVLRDHSGSDQAPLAAFTLGRILSRMGQTQRAMQAFAQVSALAPRSPLAEDALARRVEGARRAGDQATARRLAEQYLAAYPAGRRRAAVARFGGLE